MKKQAKKMKAIIRASAPTTYQLNSLTAFGMGFSNSKSGGHSAEREFDSADEAKDYLRERAEIYNSEDPEGSEERLNDMYDDIERGSLTIDAVTAYIEEIEETEDA